MHQIIIKGSLPLSLCNKFFYIQDFLGNGNQSLLLATHPKKTIIYKSKTYLSPSCVLFIIKTRTPIFAAPEITYFKIFRLYRERDGLDYTSWENRSKHLP